MNASPKSGNSSITAHPDPRSIQSVNFGCRLNQNESEQMASLAIDAGLGHVTIINSCAVTQEAERQVRQKLRSLRRHNSDGPILLAGCAPRISPDHFRVGHEVNHIIPQEDKLNPNFWQALAMQINGDRPSGVNSANPLEAFSSHPTETMVPDLRARAFVRIQTGCDHDCTFCAIPRGRGASVSLLSEQIIPEIKAKLAQGAAEIVLTGVDLTAWGLDLPGQPRLGHLCKEIFDRISDIGRLRLSSLDCIELDETLFDLFGNEPRLQPWLHLSLQSGSDLILKRMKRRHLTADAMRLMDRLRTLRPEVQFGADLIAGFPTEEETHVAETLRFVRSQRVAFLHVFPYSERADTPAARIPRQVPIAKRRERARQLRNLGNTILRSALEAKKGHIEEVLFEGSNFGRMHNGLPVRLKTGTVRSREVRRVLGISVQHGVLQGQLVTTERTE